ncbi:MAG TPA: cytochrome c oxidase assembly protein [Solirubrobacteraceae bacterium]|nr:cytochrome c oxidase assembly protein [Solirubrobacteraceae bacterium]
MSWHGWSIQVSLLYVGIAAVLYWRGGKRMPRREQAGRQAACFAAGLATIVMALDTPLDGYADQLFWVHMLQHVLLLTVAPPLILLGRPWPRMWRALPAGTRRRTGRTLARSPWTAPIRRLARPWPACLLFNATLLAWHLPGAYDLTLRSGVVHDLEHAMFFFTGLLFWARVIDPGPLRPRLQWPLRIAATAGSMITGWILAITLVLVKHPLYAHYAQIVHRPGGISALTDQQLAAGMMWVPGSIAFALTIIAGVYRWLEPEPDPRPHRSAITT